MGMELEFDERALFDAKDSFYNRLVAYIDHFERQQAFRTSAMAYYSGNHAVLDMYKSTNPKDHEVMDRLANLIVSRRGKQKKESHRQLSAIHQIPNRNNLLNQLSLKLLASSVQIRVYSRIHDGQ